MSKTNLSKTRKSAAITCVRNDTLFLKRWIAYYGSLFGHTNLYVFIDGFDQPLPDLHDKVNIIRIPHRPIARVPAMRRRARTVSNLARAIFPYYDAVIALDVDEFLVPDPARYEDLNDFIARAQGRATLSGLGLDVAQHRTLERPLDHAQPFLGQRRFAQVSTRYTKPALAFRPVTWGSGFHRIKGRNFHIAPDFYLFHFGMVDQDLSKQKTEDKDRLKSGWGGHLTRRAELFDVIAETKAAEFSAETARSRRTQTYIRQLQAWNKPAMLNRISVVEIPERFFGIV